MLRPFLTRELNSPGGISQQDQTQMLNGAEGGAGGTTAGLVSAANERAAASGNQSGSSSALDEVARQRDKAVADSASSIAAKNADTKLDQQQSAAQGLRGMYGTDVEAQLKALGLQDQAIGTETDASQTGWMQNMTNLIAALGKGAQGAGSMGLKV